MIDYPPDFPAAARAAVEVALADAEHEFIVSAAGAGSGRAALGDITWPGMWDRSDRAAVMYVADVFEAIVETSCAAARENHWPEEQLRRTSATLLSQLTESRPSRTAEVPVLADVAGHDSVAERPGRAATLFG